MNKYADHLLIIPEDDASSDLARGFQMAVPRGLNAMKVERAAGGWSSARVALSNLVPSIKSLPKRHVLVLVDFDGNVTRRETVLSVVPDELRSRVYLIGPWTEPERLQTALGHRSRESIGKALASECSNVQQGLWEHELLRHNAQELVRLRGQVLPFLI